MRTVDSGRPAARVGTSGCTLCAPNSKTERRPCCSTGRTRQQCRKRRTGGRRRVQAVLDDVPFGPPSGKMRRDLKRSETHLAQVEIGRIPRRIEFVFSIGLGSGSLQAKMTPARASRTAMRILITNSRALRPVDRARGCRPIRRRRRAKGFCASRPAKSSWGNIPSITAGVGNTRQRASMTSPAAISFRWAVKIDSSCSKKHVVQGLLANFDVQRAGRDRAKPLNFRRDFGHVHGFACFQAARHRRRTAGLGTKNLNTIVKRAAQTRENCPRSDHLRPRARRPLRRPAIASRSPLRPFLRPRSCARSRKGESRARQKPSAPGIGLRHLAGLSSRRPPPRASGKLRSCSDRTPRASRSSRPLRTVPRPTRAHARDCPNSSR